VFDFSVDTAGWIPGASDYTAGRTADLALQFGSADLPSPLRGRALRLGGNNISDDLFLFYAHRVAGLDPDRAYRVRFSVDFASNGGGDCIGGGGSLYLKAGATAFAPDTVIRDGYVGLNLDKGSQSTGGSQAVALGDAAHDGSGCEWGTGTRRSPAPGIEVRADGQGRTWLLVGAESTFEAPMEVYFTRMTATLEPE